MSVTHSVNDEASVKQRYFIKGVIGKGAFSEVRLAVDRDTNLKVAIKIMTVKDDEEYQHIKQEIEIMSKLDHDNIVKFIEMFETPASAQNKRKVYMVTELVTGGELFDRIVQLGSFDESEARDMIRTILEALGYMHQHGIVHRDLKPENILMSHAGSDAQLKIADFGLAKIVSPNKKMKTLCGTPTYVAPEVLWTTKGLEYGPEVDMWSVGVLSYVMLCGYPPFEQQSHRQMFEKIIKAEYDFPEEDWCEISDEAKDFIRCLLQPEPSQRLSPFQALEHKWMLEDKKYMTKSIINLAKLREYRKGFGLENPEAKIKKAEETSE